MTKIEEILSKVTDITPNPFEQNSFWRLDIESVMKEYAKWYAQKCLEIAANEASANFECVGAVLGAENVNPYVEQESILKIKLPPHD